MGLFRKKAKKKTSILKKFVSWAGKKALTQVKQIAKKVAPKTYAKVQKAYAAAVTIYNAVKKPIKNLVSAVSSAAKAAWNVVKSGPKAIGAAITNGGNKPKDKTEKPGIIENLFNGGNKKSKDSNEADTNSGETKEDRKDKDKEKKTLGEKIKDLFDGESESKEEIEIEIEEDDFDSDEDAESQLKDLEENDGNWFTNLIHDSIFDEWEVDTDVQIGGSNNWLNSVGGWLEDGLGYSALNEETVSMTEQQYILKKTALENLIKGMKSRITLKDYFEPNNVKLAMLKELNAELKDLKMTADISELNITSLINNQNAFSKSLDYGLKGNIPENACGSIMYHNIRLLLHEKSNYSDVYKNFKRDNMMTLGSLGGGLLGTNPFKIKKALEKDGHSVDMDYVESEMTYNVIRGTYTMDSDFVPKSDYKPFEERAAESIENSLNEHDVTGVAYFYKYGEKTKSILGFEITTSKIGAHYITMQKDEYGVVQVSNLPNYDSSLSVEENLDNLDATSIILYGIDK